MDDRFEIKEDEIFTENPGGNVKIASEVVAAIAGISAEEIKGVAYMYTSLPGAIAEKLSNKKNQAKGVKVAIGENGMTIDVYIIIEYGVRIREVSEAVQESVKNNVETMTGMNVTCVNVHVEGVSFDSVPDEEDVRIVDAD